MAAREVPEEPAEVLAEPEVDDEPAEPAGEDVPLEADSETIPIQLESAPEELPPPTALLASVAPPQAAPDQGLEIAVADELDAGSPAAAALATADVRRVSKKYWIMAGVAAVLVLGTVLLATGPKRGTLVVNVSDATGSPLAGAEIAVDGVRKCRASPCKVEGLARGTHLVAVAAAGHKNSEQKAEVEPGGRTQLAITLVTELPPPAASSTPASPPESQETTSEEDSSEPKAEKTAQTETGTKKGKRSKRGKHASDSEQDTASDTDLKGSSASKAGSGKGQLTVTSQPSGMVYIDGQPIGPSPRQTNLPAGAHTITVETDDSKKSVRVVVEAGKNSSVMVDL